MTHIYWKCLDCDEHGETSGTESGTDMKHVKATGHATFTTNREFFNISSVEEDR